jgi:integrase
MCFLKKGIIMSSARLTKRIVEAAVPSLADRFLWDSDLKGFGLKVTKAGRKVFLIQYRMGGRGSRTRRVKLGDYGVITAEQGRQKAKELLASVAMGIDPAEERKRKQERNTVSKCIAEFTSDHIEAKLKANTAKQYGATFRNDIPRSLKQKYIDEVARTDIERLHVSLKDKPYQANRTMALLSKLFNWCEKSGYRQDGSNPCRHIQKYKEEKRERFLSKEELARLGEALVEAEEKSLTSPHAIAAIRLLALTGARLGEILTLQWSFIDEERRLIVLPDSKTGKKILYLSDAALKLLSNVPRLADNPYVICGKLKGARMVNLQKPWQRIRKMAELDDVRIHDLRHSFASVAVSGGLSLPVIGAMLGHSQPQTTQRYAHLAADPIRQANDLTSAEIAQAILKSHR